MKRSIFLLINFLIITLSVYAQNSNPGKNYEKEKAYGKLMMAAGKKQDWTNFGKYYRLYFKTAYNHSAYHINNVSWTVVEHVSNPRVLKVAIKAMKYDIEHYNKNAPSAYDTYANLLYKAGKVKQAIEWEEEAVRLEADRAAKDKRDPDMLYSETLEKMRKGISIWTTESETSNH